MLLARVLVAECVVGKGGGSAGESALLSIRDADDEPDVEKRSGATQTISKAMLIPQRITVVLANCEGVDSLEAVVTVLLHTYRLGRAIELSPATGLRYDWFCLRTHLCACSVGRGVSSE